MTRSIPIISSTTTIASLWIIVPFLLFSLLVDPSSAWSSYSSSSSRAVADIGLFSHPQQRAPAPTTPTTTTPLSSVLTSNSNPNDESNTKETTNTRRSLLQSMVVSSFSSALLLVVSPVWPAAAAEVIEATEAATATSSSPKILELYQRQTDKKIAYSISVPVHFQESQKPVKTHLDEVNFVNDNVKGYQFGITVDPVRINSLQEVSS
jgi:hypothetical protein